jgi:hypothetical protein
MASRTLPLPLNLKSALRVPFPLWLVIAMCALGLCTSFVSASDDGATLKNSRLFTTPAERARLDQARFRPSKKTMVRETQVKPLPAIPRIHLQGILTRSLGPSTVWANGSSTLQGLDLDLAIKPNELTPALVAITLPDGRVVRLRPGERYDPVRNAVRGIALRKAMQERARVQSRTPPR